MDISGLEVGMEVVAQGFGPAGGRDWFFARITNFRNSFPPIVLTFTATHPQRFMQPLWLPTQRVVYMERAEVKMPGEVPDAPAADDSGRSRRPPTVRYHSCAAPQDAMPPPAQPLGATASPHAHDAQQQAQQQAQMQALMQPQQAEQAQQAQQAQQQAGAAAGAAGAAGAAAGGVLSGHSPRRQAGEGGGAPA